MRWASSGEHATIRLPWARQILDMHKFSEVDRTSAQHNPENEGMTTGNSQPQVAILGVP